MVGVSGRLLGGGDKLAVKVRVFLVQNELRSNVSIHLLDQEE